MNLPSISITLQFDPVSHRGWKTSEPLKMGDFQGPTGNLPEGNHDIDIQWIGFVGKIYRKP